MLSEREGKPMRNQRIATLIYRNLAEIFLSSVYDPRLKQVRLTTVKLSPDLKHARVLYTLPDADAGDLGNIQQVLAKSASYLRRTLAQSLSLRYTPQISFVYDSSIERAYRIHDLLNEIVLPSDSSEEQTLLSDRDAVDQLS